MATEAAGESHEPLAAAPGISRTYWSRLISLLIAVLAIVVFGYALANVTMRLQRHITSANQWQHDFRAMNVAYAGLSSAAAVRDELAYGLLRRVAWDNTTSLEEDSLQMRANGNSQRLTFVKKARSCLPNTLAGFNAQTPNALEACRQLLMATQ